MQSKSTEYGTLAASQNPYYHVKITANGVDIPDTIEDIKYVGVFNGSGALTFGNTCSAQLTFSITNPTVTLTGKELIYYEGLKLSDGTTIEYTEVGRFICTKPTYVGDKYTYTASDKMGTKFEQKYVAQVVIPNTDTAILNDISSQLGITITKPANFTEHTFQSYLGGFTYRQMLGYLAGRQGCNAIINHLGNCELRWYKNVYASDFFIDDDRIYLDSSTVGAEEDFTIGFIKCVTNSQDGTIQETLSVGTGTMGIYVENPCMTPSILSEIYSKIGGMTYRICELEFLGDFRLEVGDVIQVETNSTTYNVPIMYLEHNCDGGVRTKIESYGQTEEESTVNTLETSTSVLLAKYQGKTYKLEQSVSGLSLQIAEMQKQMDGNIEIFYREGAPTLSNFPAYDWNESPLLDVSTFDANGEIPFVYTYDSYYKHIRSLVYDTQNSVTYRFIYDDAAQVWKFAALENTDYSVILQKVYNLELTTSGLTSTTSQISYNLANNYYTRVETESKISQTADSILFSVSGSYATKATVELKLNKTDLVSELNASADVMKLTAGRLWITSGNFQLDANGNAKFGGSANVWLYPEYEDFLVMDAYIKGTGSLTPAQFTAFDFNRDGVINLLDFLILRRLILKTATIEQIISETGYVRTYSNIVVNIDPTSADKTIKIVGTNSFGRNIERYFGINGLNTSNIDCSNINVGNITVKGDMTVKGAKSRAVDTSIGLTKMGAYETPTPYFGDIGSGITDLDGIASIEIDSLFLETIEADYKVFIQPTSDSHFWVEKFEKHFIVHGNPECTFDYEIKAPQKGYGNVRFEKVEVR